MLLQACWDRKSGDPALGAVLGLVGATVLQIGVSYLALSWFTPLWLGISGLALVAWWRQGKPPLFGVPDRTSLALVGVLLVALGVRLALISRNELPGGWDPSFHCLLAEKMLLANGMVYDWKPFEDISLNYPLGAFVLLAWVKQLCGVEPHLTLKLFQSVHAVLSAALVATLAHRVGGNREVALWSAGTFAFWALGGNLHYVVYGGYPNQMGMLYVLAALCLLFGPPLPYRQWMACLCLAATYLTHHHVMLTTVLVAGMLGLVCLWQKDGQGLRLITASIAGGFLLSSFYMVPFALKVLTVTNTDVASYPEGAYGPWAAVVLMGYLFSATCLAGLVVRVKQGLVPGEKILLSLCLCLVGLFVTFDWAVRGLRWLLTGQALGVFTPWRFLSDVAPFIAYFSGYLVFAVRQRWKGSGLAFPALVVMLLGLTNLSTYRELWAVNYSYDVVRAARFIKAETPPETIVLTAVNWMPYLSWRRTGLSPIPSSEPSNVGTPKRLVIEAILAGRFPSVEQGGGPVVDLRYGVRWPQTRLLWQDPQTLGPEERRLSVLQLLGPEALVPERGWQPGQR